MNDRLPPINIPLNVPVLGQQQSRPIIMLLMDTPTPQTPTNMAEQLSLRQKEAHQAIEGIMAKYRVHKIDACWSAP